MVLLIAFNLDSWPSPLLSMLVETNSSGAVILMELIATYFFMKVFGESPFKGFAAISVVPALFSLHGFQDWAGYISPAIFGKTVSCATPACLMSCSEPGWC